MKCTHFDFDTKNKNNIGTILVLMEALKKESWDFSQFNYYLLHYELSRSFTSAVSTLQKMRPPELGALYLHM